MNLGTEIHKQCEVKGYNDYSGKRTSKLVCLIINKMIIIIDKICPHYSSGQQFVKLQTTPYKPSVIQISAPVWVVNKAGVAVEFIFGRETPVKCAGDSTVPTVIGYKTDKVQMNRRNSRERRMRSSEWELMMIV